MARNIGLVVIVLILMFLLRPQFFAGLLGVNNDPKERTASEPADAQPKRHVSRDPRAARVADTSKVEYAEGYGPEDFQGDAYKYPGDEADAAPKKSVGGLWEVFLKLQYKSRLDPKTNDIVYDNAFSEDMKKYDGQEITIQGHLIPLEEAGDNMSSMMLSAYPFQSCFFCGGAGPESVMEVFPKKKFPYKEGVVTMKGKLKLNYNDPLKLPYALKNAVLVENK